MVLTCFTPERPVLGIADIADELGMSRSTTHRYVSTLRALGYLKQVASRKYCLDIRLVGLGMSALTSNGLQHAHVYLEELCQRTSSTVSLVVLDCAEAVCIDQARGARPRQAQTNVVRPGSRWPAHCTAGGKLLLAHLPGAEQRKLIGAIKSRKHGQKTIVRKGALRDELATIREELIAVDPGESSPYLSSIASPLRNEAGEVIAAVEITVSKGIASDGIPDLLRPHLLSTTEQISARLGNRHTDKSTKRPGCDRGYV